MRPSGAPPLADLADRLATLRAALEDADRRARQHGLADADRAALKADIIALFRQADAAVQAAQALKEDVKALAGAWKHLGTLDAPIPTAPRAATPASTHVVSAAAPGTSARVDHLGASTFIEKGWSKLSLGDAAGAEVALRKALALSPANDEAETLLGWAQMQQERYEDALRTLQGVLARDPTHAMARVNIGYICLRKGIPGEAIEHLTTAIRDDRDRKATLYGLLYLGLVYREREMFDDAETFFLRALALGPNLLQAWYELGQSRWEAGRHADALAAWRAGAESNKFNPWGKRCAEMIALVEQGGVPAR